MNTERLFEGKDLQEALQTAAHSLGIAEPDLDYEIVEQGRRGLWGIGARSMRIRVMPPLDESSPGEARKRVSSRRSRGRRREGGRSEERPAPQPKSPASSEAANRIRESVQKMVDLMGLELAVTCKPADGGVNVELKGGDRKLLIRRDAELLLAMQFLLNRMARRAWPGAGRIHLTCDGTRRRRDEDVIDLVHEVAQQVSRTGQSKRLHPMNSYERRLVHLTVRKLDGVASRSEGDGYLKKVKIYKPRPRDPAP